MKVAISIWDGKVSPVLDAARQLLVADIRMGKNISRELVNIPQLNYLQLARFICEHNIDILICGAVSHQLESLLMRHGIDITPWVKGDVDDIIASFEEGRKSRQFHYLPGYKSNWSRRRKGRRHNRSRDRKWN